MSETKPTRRIVCAALRAADGTLLIGIRHYSADMHAQIKARPDGYKFYHRNGLDQGFVDQYGAYMDRSEAYQVALAAGQIIDFEACDVTRQRLHSEGVY